MFIYEPHVPRKCGAYARSSGQACKQYALANGRCHYHGGKTPIKHGRRTKVVSAEKVLANKVICDSLAIIDEMNKIGAFP